MKIEINLTEEQMKQLFGDNRIRTNGEDPVRRNDEDHVRRNDEDHVRHDDLEACKYSDRAVPQDGRVRDALEACKDPEYTATQDDRPCDTLVGIYHDLLEVRNNLLNGRRRAALDKVDDMVDDLDNVLAER